MIPITLKSLEDEKELRLLKGFLLRQPQFYPKYREWVDGKCADRIEKGMYKTIIAISEGAIIGDVVYRFLDGNIVELKNFRIDANYQNRDLGHFLLKQIEAEANPRKMTLDITVSNFSGVEFFIRNRFKIKRMERIYLPEQDEYIMEKLCA